MWLHTYLYTRGYCSATKPKILKKIGKNGKIYHSMKIRSWSFTSFNFIYDSFYHNNVKILPNLEFLKQWCTPLALAIWFMDDGSKNGTAGVFFHTNCFSLGEVRTLQQLLLEKYGLNSTYSQRPSLEKNRGYILYISKRDLPLFISIVKPCLVPSMYYKVGLCEQS
jgi:hypothetical protein